MLAATCLAIVGDRTASAENTAPGSPVYVTDFDPALLVIHTVTVGGDTSYQAAPSGPALPAGYVDVSPEVVREFTTTAAIAGPFQVCIPYSGSSFGVESNLRLMWLDPNSSAWVDVTTDWRASQQRVCGAVTALAPLRVAERAATPPPPIPAIRAVSVSSGGQFGNANSANSLGEGGVSSNGRWVVFDSNATNLAGSVATNYNVYRRDVVNGLTQLVNSASDGVSFGSAISADGRHISYTASGSVRVRDMQSPGSVVVGPGSSSDISGDGRWVVYVDSPGMVQVHDRDPDVDGTFDEPGTTTVPLIIGFGPKISPNGRFVYVVSNSQAYVIDRDADADGVFDNSPILPVLVNAAADGTPGDDGAGGGDVANDGDATFYSFATNLGGTTLGVTPGQGNIFVRDFDTAAIELIGQVVSNLPTISADGRYVSYDSFVTNGVSNDTNGFIDVFRYDRASHSLTLMSLTDAGASVDSGSDIAISGDGQHVAFVTYSAATPSDTNGASDLYLASLATPGSDPTPPNTPTGSLVSVSPDDSTTGQASGVTLTFGTVTSAGVTTVSSGSAPPLPAGYQVAGMSLDIATTASYTGPVVLCFDYSSLTGVDESTLALLHFDSVGAAWEDITIHPLDTIGNVICGESNTLSPFVIGAGPNQSTQPTIRPVSVSSTGQFGNNDSGNAVGAGGVSANGRWVAIDSLANNLGTATSNSHNIYLRDLVLGQTRLMNPPGGGIGFTSAMSDDGRWVAYGDASSTVRVRSPLSSSSVAIASGSNVDLSGDGRWVVYTDFSGMLQIRDRDPDADGVFDEAGVTTHALTVGNYARLSPNARFVMFVGNDFMPYVVDRDPDGNGVFDEAPAVPVLVNASQAGIVGNDIAGRGDVADNGDVAFWSYATNLEAVPYVLPAGQANVYVRTFDTGAIELVGRRISNSPSISSDGRFVAFDSFDDNGFPDDTNGWTDVFRYDRDAHVLDLVSVTDTGAQLAGSHVVGISGDGQHVAFGTFYAATPSDTNGRVDVYLASFADPGPSAEHTPVGTDVPVSPPDTTTGQPSGVTITFDAVTTSGDTTVTSSAGPALPVGYQAAGLSFDIHTTASYTAPIDVCFDYSAVAGSIADESALALMHYEASAWQDITTALDTVNNVICGQTSSLSPFALARFTGNHPPTIALQAPSAPVRLGSAVAINASVSDADAGNQLMCTVNWGSGPTAAVSAAAGQCPFTRSDLQAGVYIVTVTVTDGHGGTASARALAVVYDPNGGFVTGGGWIDSPAGAYAANPSLTGKATFGFVAKYKKGTTVPTGDTEFQFNAGALSFSATNFDWLVVAGSKAKFKGSGTVNGVAGYTFMITAADGSPDQFRIRIWNGSGTIYDNRSDVLDETSYAATNLGGGSIIVHKE